MTYTVAQVAKKLGVSRNHVYELVHTRVIPSIRIGESIRIPIKDFDSWFESQIIRGAA